MKTTYLFILALAATLYLSPVTALAEEAAAPQQDTAPAVQEAAAEDTVVATVNGVEIGSMLLDKVMGQIPSGAAGTEGSDVRKKVLDKLIDLELVAQEAGKEGLDKDPEFKLGMEMYKKQQLFALYLNKAIVEKVKVDPEEVKKYYEDNKKEFETGEEIRASHILVDSEDKAKDIKARLDAGEDFEALAKAESSCPSASRGGDLGFFGKGAMVPEFEEAAFALGEGEVSGPVKTQFGWHIIKVTEKKPAGTKSFEDAKDEIEQKLLQEKQQKAYEDLLEKLRKDADITVSMDTLDKEK